MFLKQKSHEKWSFEGKYARGNIKFPRGNYQANSSETLALYCFFTQNFLGRPSQKIILNSFQHFKT